MNRVMASGPLVAQAHSLFWRGMRISEVVWEALNKPDELQLKVLADWIEENSSGHPESDVYSRRLRDTTSVRVSTIVDVIAKFGTRQERKEISRIMRLSLKRRKHQLHRELRQVPPNLFSLDARRMLNFANGNIVPPENHGGRYNTSHKKTVLAQMRKTRVFLYDPNLKNGWWLLTIIRQLMGVIHSKE